MVLSYAEIVYYLNKITLFLGIPLLASGLVGNFLSLVVFLSLRTFRTNPCSFYFICGSLVNIGHLITGFLTRLLVNGFSIDWTLTSVFYCKCRHWLFQLCVLTSLTCTCLATIDQYFATSPRLNEKRFNNLKFAHRLVIGTIIVWILHGIPFALTADIRNGSCIFNNERFLIYYKTFFFPCLLGIFPLIIMNSFSFLTFLNIRDIRQRQLPIIRRELDRQLATMLFGQVICLTITTIPFIAHYTFFLNGTFTDSMIFLEHQFIAAILNLFWQCGYSILFYIHFCSSNRFRKQFCYVFSFQHPRYQQNQVQPEQVVVEMPIITIGNAVRIIQQSSVAYR